MDIRCSFSTGVYIPEYAWEQVQQSLKIGGFGLHSMAKHLYKPLLVVFWLNIIIYLKSSINLVSALSFWYQDNPWPSRSYQNWYDRGWSVQQSS